MFLRKCDLCGEIYEPKKDITSYIPYALPLGEEKQTSIGATITNRFGGWEPMSTDLCFKCTDKIRNLCIEIHEESQKKREVHNDSGK